MPREHQDQPVESETSSRGADLAKELDDLLTDSPGTEPASKLVEDDKEAHEMGLASDERRAFAANQRAWSVHHIVDSEEGDPSWHDYFKREADKDLHNAELSDAQAEVLETWAQGLHAHPEFAGKALDGEELTPEHLTRLEQELGGEEHDIHSLEELAEKILSSPYSERWNFEQKRFTAGSDEREGRMVPDSAKLYEKLGNLKSRDETTIGELKKLQASYLQKAAQEYREHLVPRKALLDKIRG